jgi:hypothetical protein
MGGKQAKGRHARARTHSYFPGQIIGAQAAGWRSASSKCSPAFPFPPYSSLLVPVPPTVYVRSYEHDSKRNRCCCQRENPCVKALQRRLCRHQARAHRQEATDRAPVRYARKESQWLCIVVSDSEALSVVLSFFSRAQAAGRVWTLTRRALK